MKTLLITRGLPASGKSTHAKALLGPNSNWKRVNKDDIRAMTDNEQWSKQNEEMVLQSQDMLIRLYLRAGYNVVADSTHLVADRVKELHRIAEDVGDVNVSELWFLADVEECVRRNALRTGTACVPEKVIRDMSKRIPRKTENRETFYPARVSSLPVATSPTLPKAVLCDLDGTLALHVNRDPYDAAKCELDAVNPSVLAVLRALWLTEHEIVFVSGRENAFREQTERWLKRVLEVPYTYLYMRKTGDKRKDSEVKREIYEEAIHGKYSVTCVLDDRNQVVEGWRGLGLNCWQVNSGAF